MSLLGGPFGVLRLFVWLVGQTSEQRGIKETLATRASGSRLIRRLYWTWILFASNFDPGGAWPCGRQGRVGPLLAWTAAEPLSHIRGDQ